MNSPSEILTKEFLQKHYIDLRKSVKTIALEQNIKSHNSVSQKLKIYGMSRRSLKDSSYILTKEFLQEHYVNQNKSLKTIVNEIGFKRKSIVKNALIKHGISVREHTMSEKFKNELTSRTKHNIPGNFFYSIKSSASIRGYEFDLTKDDIWDLFIKQNKKCAYSGIELIMYTNKKNERTASLDRINNDIGYVIDNIQWVHKDVNLMKSDKEEKYFINLCKTIYEYSKDKL